VAAVRIPFSGPQGMRRRSVWDSEETQGQFLLRVELDRQYLANVDLLIAVGGDGTVLSSAHFLDNGTIPLLGINRDPMVSTEDQSVQKKTDERR